MKRESDFSRFQLELYSFSRSVCQAFVPELRVKPFHHVTVARLRKGRPLGPKPRKALAPFHATSNEDCKINCNWQIRVWRTKKFHRARKCINCNGACKGAPPPPYTMAPCLKRRNEPPPAPVHAARRETTRTSCSWWMHVCQTRQVRQTAQTFRPQRSMKKWPEGLK